ncbi:MAG: hypothetical protein KDA80_07215, partial [Planctomycetaceae bacterium]|nr:hypothetical protein [Planctomycetaceae bacterium]
PRSHLIPILGPHSPLLFGWTFYVDQSGTHIEILDGSGKQLNEKIRTNTGQSRNPSGQNLGFHVETKGHLALIVLADRFFLVDLLTTPGKPQVLTTRLLGNSDDAQVSIYRQRRIALGMRSFRSIGDGNNFYGSVGPLNSNVLCYSVKDELIALNPTTGGELWRRKGIPADSEIFGDESYVILKPPGHRELEVYDATDGTFLHKADLPRTAIRRHVQREGGDWGRFFPCVESGETEFVWSLYDPASRNSHWERSFPPKTAWTTINGFDLAFLTPAGELSICSGETGETLGTVKLELPQVVRQLTVIESPDSLIVLTSLAERNFSHFESYGMSISDLAERLVDGTVASVDRDSYEIAWSRSFGPQIVAAQYPKLWPVLIFAQQRLSGIDGAVLHRQSGEEIWSGSFEEGGRGVTWSGETQTFRIRIGLGAGGVSLDCRVPLNATE